MSSPPSHSRSFVVYQRSGSRSRSRSRSRDRSRSRSRSRIRSLVTTVSDLTPEEEIKILEEAVTKLESEKDSKPSALLIALLQLGEAYLRNGQTAEADTTLHRVKDGRVNVWGWDHTGSIACVKSLVEVFELKNDFNSLTETLNEAIIGVSRALGREHPWALELQNDAGYFFMQRQELDLAKAMFGKAASGAVRVLGQDHRCTLMTKCNEALVSYFQGELNPANEVFLRSYEFWKARYGTDGEELLGLARQVSRFCFETENAHTGYEICQELGIRPPEPNCINTVHRYSLVPSYLTKGKSVDDGAEDILTWLLDKLGPKYGRRAVMALNWTRESVMKWTGKTVAEFAELVMPSFPMSKKLSDIVEVTEMLKAAAALGHEVTVRMLLEKLKQLQKNDKTALPQSLEALHNASFHGHIIIVKLLLEHRVDVDILDTLEQRPLHKAASHGHAAVAQLLLDFGAEVDKPDKNGDSPLDEAMKRNHENIIRVFMAQKNALISSSNPITEPRFATDHSIPDKKIKATVGFDATIVDFYVDNKASKGFPVEEHRVQRIEVETLLSEGGLRGVAATRKDAGYPDPDFRWIHLPANNMEWVETLITKIQFEESSDTNQCLNLLKTELWKDQQHQSIHSAFYSRFMKPYCRAPDDNCLVVFQVLMPYIHWETEESRDKMAKIINTVDEYNQKEMLRRIACAADEAVAFYNKFLKDGDGLTTRNFEKTLLNHLNADEKERDQKLLERYLCHEPPIHIRRTLDQFHYYMTDNTDARDADQVISRYVTRKYPGSPVPVMMVDQLWLWVVDQRTVVTAFPQRWGQNTATMVADDMLNMTDVLDSILKHLHQRFRDPVTSVYALSELIVARCLGLNFNYVEWAHERYKYLEIFEYSINFIADEEVRCFNAFADRGSRDKKDKIAIEKARRNVPHRKGYTRSLGKELEDLYDISQEIELLKEIKDIRDELNILRNLFNQQKGVLDKFCALGLPTSRRTRRARSESQRSDLKDAIQRHVRYVADLDRDARRPYAALEKLLDLKQKQANVSEARTTRISGNTITVFTIVTIIFLPASFMATFLALPIAQYPKEDGNFDLLYAVKYLSITTVAMAVPFIILALYVNPLMRLMRSFFYSIRDLSKKLKVRDFKFIRDYNFMGYKIHPFSVIRFTASVIFSVIYHSWKAILKLGWLILKNFNLVIQLLWLFLRATVTWGGLKFGIRAVKSYRKNKKETKKQGQQWSKRRWIIGRAIAGWERRQEKKKNKDEEAARGAVDSSSSIEHHYRGRSRSRERSERPDSRDESGLNDDAEPSEEPQQTWNRERSRVRHESVGRSEAVVGGGGNNDIQDADRIVELDSTPAPSIRGNNSASSHPVVAEGAGRTA